MRNGRQRDLGPGLDYQGQSPNDVGLSAALFSGNFGGALSLQREGFGLYSEDGNKVASGALYRAGLGPACRIQLGPLRLEGLLGYQLAQLPLFGQSTAPAFQPATRHSALIASRVLVDLPLGTNLQIKGELPVAVSTKDGQGRAAKSSGFAAGAGLGIPLGRVEGTVFGLLLDYQYVSDKLEGDDSVTSSQTLSRIGAALTVSFGDAPPKVVLGTLLLSVVDEKNKAPLSGAEVVVSAGGKSETLTTDANGKLELPDVPKGAASAKATLAGYLPGEAQTEVAAGGVSTLAISLRKEPPKVGGIRVQVVTKDGQKPIEGAVVLAKGEELLTGADGSVRLANLPPGPLELKVRAAGYREAVEAGSVVAGRDSDVPVELVLVKQKVPASLTGFVRSSRGGAPVAAKLEIPELKLKTQADQAGGFAMRVPGGTYRVIISAEGFISQQKSVAVKDGDQAIFNVNLFPR